MFWGFCEPLDLHGEYEEHFQSIYNNSTGDLNILLFGSGDIRHILKTLSKAYTRKNNTKDGCLVKKINFYVLEGCMELIARQILLLNIALEPSDDLSLKGKTHTFMDIYGNSLLRPSSHHYMCAKANMYQKLITDLDGYGQDKFPIINLTNLKYAERDNLENIYQFWLNKTNHKFDIEKHWDQRLRSLLGVRYDTRMGAFDWDLSMKLKYNGCERICAQEYKHFRSTGIAFVFPEYDNALPNKTLAAGIHKDGQKFGHRGYLGDILVGPFTTFGIKCSDAFMLKSSYGTNYYRATDITERNLFEMMYEIQENQPYQHKETQSRELGASVIQLSKNKPCIDLVNVSIENNLKKYDNPILEHFRCQSDVTITFLSVEDILKIQTNAKFNKFFHVVFVGQIYFHFIRSELLNILRPAEALLIFETKQYSTLRKEEITEFLNKIKKFAKENDSLKPITNFNINLPLPIIRFKNSE